MPRDPRADGLDQTNNAGELLAAVEALEAAPVEPLEVRTDSSYVRDGATRHRARWRELGWRARALAARRIPNAALGLKSGKRNEVAGVTFIEGDFTDV